MCHRIRGEHIGGKYIRGYIMIVELYHGNDINYYNNFNVFLCMLGLLELGFIFMGCRMVKGSKGEDT